MFKTVALFLALLAPLSTFAGTGSGDFGGGISQSQVGQPNGVASLDNTGKVPLSQIPGGGGGSATWGAITGTLSSQTDLNTALSGKQASLGFTPEDVANKSIDGTLSANSDTLYSSQKAVKTYADTKQSALGFTPENVANKDTDGTLSANSDTKYASQKATKTYADTKQSALGFTPENVANKSIDGTLSANSDTLYPSQKAVKTYADTKQSALTPGTISSSTSGVHVVGGSNSTVGPSVTVGVDTATNSQPGLLSAADHTTYSAKQSTLLPGHDFWIDRNGSDTANCSIAAPCQTVGYALTLVSSPSSTNNYTIHLLSGRHDQEVDDLLITPYTWIVGNGGPDVGGYLRLPAGKAIKLGSGWTANARGGIQGIYLGGSGSLNLDFAAAGGSAGSNFMLDDVFVTGTVTHTGRGVNGGDFLIVNNSTIFGATSLTGSEFQSDNTFWLGSFTAVTGTAVPSDLLFVGGQVNGAFSFTQGNAQTATLGSSGTTYASTFTTVGTIALTADLNLPIGYTLSGGTTRTNYTNAASVPFAPGVSGNWNSVPALVSSGLDTLASSGIVKSQAQNLVLASPSGSSGVMTPRALVAADLPSGSIVPSLTAGSVPYANGTTLIQDNTNFFFDDTNKSLSVGPGPHPATSADLAISSQAGDTKVGLSVFSTSTNNAVQIQNQSGFSLAALVADAANSPSLNFERARGTLAAKTQAKAGDLLGSFVFNGYTGTTDGPFAAGFGAVALEDQASGHGGAEILFQTTPIASGTLATRMVIDSTGKVQIPGLTASRALVTDASSNLAVSATTATQVGYLSTSTSDIQTQINLKQARLLVVTNGGNAAYTILSTDDEVRAGTTLTADRAYTLPACVSGNVGERHLVKNPFAQTFNVTLTAAGPDLIDGNATMTIYPSQSLTAVCAAAAVWDIN